MFGVRSGLCRGPDVQPTASLVDVVLWSIPHLLRLKFGFPL